MTNQTKSNAARWTWRIFGFLAVGITICVGYTVYSTASTAINAEHNLHSSLFVVRLVEEFVLTNERWPTSWSELEDMAYTGDAYTPANAELSALRVGGAREFTWPADSPELQKRIKIDFQPDISKLVKQNHMKFTAIEPVGPTFEFRDYGIVESLQETLRKVTRNAVPPDA